jgi:uncharacterized membrane protein
MQTHTGRSIAVNKLRAVHKLLISVVLAVIAYALSGLLIDNTLARFLFAWNAFCLTMISLDWIIFFTSSHLDIRKQARAQDGSTFATFLIVLICILSSLAAVFSIVINRDSDNITDLLLGIGGMIGSWCLMHTLFAVRYAHTYYDDDKNDATKHAAGLNFPDDEKPDFLDFAYFAFVIGMTFQVSDVEITEKKLRRLVLVQSVISFAFNTFIVALVINIIAGFSHG